MSIHFIFNTIFIFQMETVVVNLVVAEKPTDVYSEIAAGMIVKVHGLVKHFW